MSAGAGGADPELICRTRWITLTPVEAAGMANREFDYDCLVKPLESRMMRAIWRVVRQRETAEDALQDALAVVWKKRDAVANHPNPQALILKISVAAAYDAVRKDRRRLRHEIGSVPDRASRDSADPTAQNAEDRSLWAAVQEAIGCLPRRQAVAALLRIVEEQSYEEIGRAMDCTETTARIHVMRARNALAIRLARYRPSLAMEADGIKKESSS
jgi:RNA polymerase sigma factor (sigma-70 family)